MKQLCLKGVDLNCPLCRRSLPEGPDKVYDKAYRKSIRVIRMVRRGEEDWESLSSELRREMNDANEMLKKVCDILKLMCKNRHTHMRTHTPRRRMEDT